MIVVIVGSLLAGALYTWFAGEDVNWDWRSYHEYGAFALLNGRFNIDVAPGGHETFLNPLVYVPAYLLRHMIDAPWWGMLLGAIHGLNLAAIYWISAIALGYEASTLALAASVLIAAFGPMTLSEVGTSFADILTALPILTGVGLVLSAGERQPVRLVIAGALIGAAAGLKLTNMTYVIGAAACLLYASRPFAAMASFALGSAAGAVATGGAWVWTLWVQFKNPIFPFYNSIFRSPEAPLVPLVDTRFMPHGVLDAAAYPFYWLIGDHRSSDWAFRDPRFAVLMVLVALTIAIGRFMGVTVLRQRDKQFLWLFFLSYALWMQEFSIQRYAIALEFLTAPLIVLLLCRLAQALGPAWTEARRATGILAFVVASAVAGWSQPGDWLRRPWSSPYQPQIPHALQIPATYLMLEKPLGYVVPLLPPASRAYQLSDIVMPIKSGGMLDQRVRWGLAHELQGGVWALHLRGSPPRQELLAPYDLAFDASRPCELIPGADGIDIEACPLSPTRRSPAAGHDAMSN